MVWFTKRSSKKILKEKLNSSEFRYFRTAEGKFIMALNSYSALKTSIANWLNRSDLTTEIEDFIVINRKRFQF